MTFAKWGETVGTKSTFIVKLFAAAQVPIKGLHRPPSTQHKVQTP